MKFYKLQGFLPPPQMLMSKRAQFICIETTASMTSLEMKKAFSECSWEMTPPCNHTISSIKTRLTIISSTTMMISATILCCHLRTTLQARFHRSSIADWNSVLSSLWNSMDLVCQSTTGNSLSACQSRLKLKWHMGNTSYCSCWIMRTSCWWWLSWIIQIFTMMNSF